jgi:hypothetical protein
MHVGRPEAEVGQDLRDGFGLFDAEFDAENDAHRPRAGRADRGIHSLYARLGEPPERGGGLPVRFDG